VRLAVVAPTNEKGGRVRRSTETFPDSVCELHLGGVGFEADDHEVIECNFAAVRAVTLGHECGLARPCMNKDGIDVARFSKTDQLPCTDNKAVHTKAGIRFDLWHEDVAEARIVKPGGDRECEVLSHSGGRKPDSHDGF
jgi:hypothetical protein